MSRISAVNRKTSRDTSKNISHLKDKNCRNDRLSEYNYSKIRTIIKEKIQDLLDTTSKYMSHATHFCPNSYNCMGNKTKTSNRWFLLRCLLLLLKC